MPTVSSAPECPVDAAITRADIDRLQHLQQERSDSCGALPDSERAELAGLEALWSRYLGWRGKVEDYFKAAERAEQQALSPNRHDPSGDLGRQVLALARAPSRRVIEREMVEVRNPDGSIIRVQKTAEPQRYRSSAELQAGGLARIENGFDRGQGRR